ncbi:MAG: hypothetical protein KAI57_04240 [Candidatus Pacebacteria bacterium]|nr:hypothetical protein [Candidatus Paceibacterota bacterium]
MTLEEEFFKQDLAKDVSTEVALLDDEYPEDLEGDPLVFGGSLLTESTVLDQGGYERTLQAEIDNAPEGFCDILP